jgi:hypothetical protein
MGKHLCRSHELYLDPIRHGHPGGGENQEKQGPSELFLSGKRRECLSEAQYAGSTKTGKLQINNVSVLLILHKQVKS